MENALQKESFEEICPLCDHVNGKVYAVKITETLEKVVYIEAESPD